jgi:hypothetical protein
VPPGSERRAISAASAAVISKPPTNVPVHCASIRDDAGGDASLDRFARLVVDQIMCPLECTGAQRGPHQGDSQDGEMATKTRKAPPRLPAPISQESAVAGPDLNLRKFNEPYRRALQIRSDVREIRERFAPSRPTVQNRTPAWKSAAWRSLAKRGEANKINKVRVRLGKSGFIDL